jgi:hypothetical protein
MHHPSVGWNARFLPTHEQIDAPAREELLEEQSKQVFWPVKY